MTTIHLHSCHQGNAVNSRAVRHAVTEIGTTTYPWLVTDMVFATKRQRLKDHSG
ncbi:MAG: hypothetical protein OEW42_01135 [Acidimicrobiia bacterium]|nr:hypothetical protein [Acidimicrobiia bacterium]